MPETIWKVGGRTLIKLEYLLFLKIDLSIKLYCFLSLLSNLFSLISTCSILKRNNSPWQSTLCWSIFLKSFVYLFMLCVWVCENDFTSVLEVSGIILKSSASVARAFIHWATSVAQCVSIYHGQLIYLSSPQIWESTNISDCCDCLIYCEVYLTRFACQMCFGWWNSRGFT